MNSIEIRVRYPYKGAQMVIFSELNWEDPIHPVEVDENKHLTLFRVETDKTFLYYKPCLIIGEERHFCRGANYLSITAADENEIFPHFFEKSVGTITDTMTFGAGEEARSVRIYLPPGYEENTLRRYPVCYVHDGHNLFFPEEALSGQTWEVTRTLTLLDNMNVIDPVIVVAIYPKDRMHEYTHPGYVDYGKFIVDIIKPQVDEPFRTLTEARFTAGMGSSLGGVVSLYMGWEYPHIFGKVACLSSTFTWKDDLMARIRDEEKRDPKIYMDSDWPGDNFEISRAMFDLLQRQGYEVNQDVMYLAFPEAGHGENDWATRVHIPFHFSSLATRRTISSVYAPASSPPGTHNLYRSKENQHAKIYCSVLDCTGPDGRLHHHAHHQHREGCDHGTNRKRETSAFGVSRQVHRGLGGNQRQQANRRNLPKPSFGCRGSACLGSGALAKIERQWRHQPARQSAESGLGRHRDGL